MLKRALLAATVTASLCSPVSAAANILLCQSKDLVTLKRDGTLKHILPNIARMDRFKINLLTGEVRIGHSSPDIYHVNKQADFRKGFGVFVLTPTEKVLGEADNDFIRIE